MRNWVVLLGLLGMGACATSAVADTPEFTIGLLPAALSDAPAAQLSSGALDARFAPYDAAEARQRSGSVWLRVTPLQASTAKEASAVQAVPGADMPVLVVHRGRQAQLQVYAHGEYTARPRLAALPQFRAAQDEIFALPTGSAAGQAMYVRVTAGWSGSEQLRFSLGTLGDTLARGTGDARIIALSFGALLAMSLAALTIWTLLADRVFLLYGLLFSTQALFVVYLSGQGFHWPLLGYAAPLNSLAWNLPSTLGGAASCLLARELADLQRYAPRIYRILGGFAYAFVALIAANLLKLLGLSAAVNAVGNLLFIACAGVTLAGAFLAWRRGSSAAGWFLVAWTLLEAFTIVAALRLLFVPGAPGGHLLNYYGLPLSMVAAAILIALGVADRLREQRLALSEAEKRAQTDALTGVLNRRSLIERLDAACLRAQARGLPIAVLFIDLDHFKQINDSFGHQAGDACLRAIIEPIHAELRQSDVIGRFGGEEFVVLLSSADAAAARPIAQRILERVGNVRVEGYGQTIRLTCSIGVAASDALGVWGEHLIAHADAAVYVAKRLGRNQVQLATGQAA
jgi:diguanylate cyclase (GGDEF)-like protein